MPKRRICVVRVVSIVGQPISQVASPRIWNRSFIEEGSDTRMVPREVSPAGLADYFERLRDARNCAGAVVTIPHKVPALSLCDRLTPRAAAVGAVNAVRRLGGGGLEGDMFDGVGMTRAIRNTDTEVRGRRVLILGCGAAGAAIAHALCDEGVGEVYLSDRIRTAAERLGRNLEIRGVNVEVLSDAIKAKPVDIAVNASPAGSAAMPEPPFPLDRFAASTLIADVVTDPAPTAILLAAAERGHATVSGTDMAEAQAPLLRSFFGV